MGKPPEVWLSIGHFTKFPLPCHICIVTIIVICLLREWLSSFSKRKKQRQKIAQEKLEAAIKEEKLKDRQEVNNDLHSESILLMQYLYYYYIISLMISILHILILLTVSFPFL